MRKIKKLLKLSLIKTLIFNIRYFGIKGLKLPCLVSRNTKFERLSGKVILEECKFGSVLIGFGPIQASGNISKWYNNGTIVFKKEAHLYTGFFIYNNGIINCGENFRIAASKLFCEKKIDIMDDVMISWDCLIMDSDLHSIKKNGKRINEDKPIIIGKHVWICSNSTLFKGTHIADNSIVSSNSIISNKKCNVVNCIYGNKGIILKEDIEWNWSL